MSHRVPVSLRVNGETYDLVIPASKTLLEVLREDLSLTGAKRSCQEGQCGACTVLVDRKAVNSCLCLAIEAQGRDIVTIEGLARNNGSLQLHPVQKSFMQKGAVQCGFCTPGMIMAAVSLLEENPHPSEEDIRQSLVGHLCRCTGYFQIIEAILDASREDQTALAAAEGRG